MTTKLQAPKQDKKDKQEQVLALQYWDAEHRCLITQVRRNTDEGARELSNIARPGSSIYKLPADCAGDTDSLMRAIARARTDNNFLDV